MANGSMDINFKLMKSKLFYTYTFLLLFLSLAVNAQLSISNIQKASAEYNNKNLEQAIFYLNKSVKNNNSNYKLYILRGKYHLENKNFKNAFEDLKKASNLYPECCNYEIATYYAQSNNSIKASEYLKKYLNNYIKKPEAIIKNDIMFEPIRNTNEWNNLWSKQWYNNKELKLYDAEYAYKKQRYTQSIEILDKLLSRYKTLDKAYFIKAKVFYETKSYKAAHKAVDLALKYNKRNYEYYNLKAKIYEAEQKYNKAIDYYNSTLKKNPLLIDTYYFLAICYFKTKKYKNALEYINAYLELYPDKDKSKILKFNILNNSQQQQKALRIINPMIKKSPKNAELYYLRAKAYHKSQMYQFAVNDYSQALDINPTLTNIYYERAFSEFEMNNIEKACMDWKEAVKNENYKANQYLLKYCRAK